MMIHCRFKWPAQQEPAAEVDADPLYCIVANGSIHQLMARHVLLQALSVDPFVHVCAHLLAQKHILVLDNMLHILINAVDTRMD